MPDAPVHLGTSSFTATGWNGSFYPAGMPSREYLTFYAEHFDSVEIDSTFYACPSESTVKGWLVCKSTDVLGGKTVQAQLPILNGVN